MNVQALPTTCSKCGGNGHWDNRADKRNPKAPDFKCKNKGCGEGVWLPKGAVWVDQVGQQPAPYQSPSYTSPNAPPNFLADQEQHETQAVAAIQHNAGNKLQGLFSLYDVCLDHAATVAAGSKLPAECVPAMAATLFIAAKDRGLAA